MKIRNVVLGVVSVLATHTPAPAVAVDVCATLAGARRFVLVASRLTTKRSTVPYIQGVGILGSVCVDRATLDITSIYDYTIEVGDDLVATRATGRALRIKGIGDDYGGRAYVAGDVATGGGAIAGTFDEVGGVIDTSGTHPAVAACQGAMADALTASDTLAALPPTQTLGNVFVPVDGTYEIHAEGGAVVQLDSLVLEGVPMRRQYGELIRTCDDGGARVYVFANPGDVVILNLGHLDVGHCAGFRQQVPGGRVADPGVVLNVPGGGRRIRVGVEADLYDGFNLLAPRRSLVVAGSSYDYDTTLSHVWVKRAKMQAFSTAQSNWPCSPSCAFVD